ncbi:response regulator receiver domain [Undibacterium sp. Di27W]|uniref:response regulator receiver domain n=1 Tax=Undibacterium sp. Di27W TaxID=3413036 RepID=UPI003BF2530D
MSEVLYKDLVTKTFRDESIRSVIMIDDDFLPYDELCLQTIPFADLPEPKKIGTAKAAAIHKFFQSKKITCDIDKGADNIDIEKIRKCDLVILDYHLEQNDPKKSINIIKGLSETDHMNLVVVYTREPLERVWLEIASSIYGSANIEDTLGVNKTATEYWDNNTDSGASIPEEWKSKITYADLEEYAITGKATKSTIKWFCQNTIANIGSLISDIVCSHAFSQFNILNSQQSHIKISGKNSEIKWIHFGNVFVVLTNKSAENGQDDPLLIWNEISKALVDWAPTYYQLLISEMQNRLENEPISFSRNLSHDPEGQAGWLHQILSSETGPNRGAVIDQLFSYLTDELEQKLLSDRKMAEVLTSVFDSLLKEFLAQEVPQKVDLLTYCAKHVNLNIPVEKHKEYIGHALNYTLCSTEFDNGYVTSGTILLGSNSNDAYLCVAPACETVPMQHTGHLTQKLKPHRLMKVLHLTKTELRAALQSATNSNCIFLKTQNGQRYAYSVVNTNGHPTIDYLLVKNHDTSTRAQCVNGISVSFISTDSETKLTPEEKMLHPIAQLRDIYTARFQALASHHIGRVGVDFINFK